MSIFTFNEQINNQSSVNIIQELLIDQNFKNIFEDELVCLDESIKDALLSYIPLEKIVNQFFEEMFEDELKFLGNHVVDTSIVMCDNDKL